jgi:tetratricopeptide (TPR) repeat protein
MLAASFAFAGPSFKELNEAKKLAADGKQLAKKGDFAKAAKKYKKADDLVPAPSYKLELARMLLEVGDLVQANQVAKACAETSPRQWAEKKAHKECQSLAKEVDERVPTLEITVFEPSADQVTVKVDGNDFDPAEGAVEYNPGSYAISATADGFADFSEKVKLAEGDVTAVEVRMKKVGAAAAADDVEEEDGGGGLSPVPAYISWGIGAVGLGVGIGFGVAAIKSTNEVLRLYGCEDGTCPPEAEDDLNTAKTNGNVSTAGFIIGFAGVTAGTILYLLSGDDEDEEDTEESEGALLRVEARPLLAPGYVGVTGTF